MAKATWKRVKGQGMRCVIVKSNGQWKFAKKSACKGKARRSRKRR